MVAVGAQLREPAVLDRRDHPAQRLADATEGDPLVHRHAASLPDVAEPDRDSRPILQVYTRFLDSLAGTCASDPNPACAASISLDLPRATAPPPEPPAQQAPAGACSCLLVVAGIAALSAAGYVLSVAASAPALESLKPIDQGTSSVVFAADGSRLGYIQSDEIRTPIPLQRIPESMQAATIAIEDERYYEHGGVDYEGIVRAAFKNLEAGKAVEGGSTITMQLVRNLYVGPRAHARAQDQGGAPGRGAGGRALQALDPAELSQLGAVRHRRRPDRRRRAGRGADVLRQAGQEPHARGVRAARRAAAGAQPAEPVPEQARRARASQQGAEEDGRAGLHLGGARAARARARSWACAAATSTSRSASRSSSTS